MVVGLAVALWLMGCSGVVVYGLFDLPSCLWVGYVLFCFVVAVAAITCGRFRFAWVVLVLGLVTCLIWVLVSVCSGC